MKKLIVTLAILATGAVKANTGGTLFINSNNTEASLLISESMVDGDLSKLFDQMKIEAVGTEARKTKTFQISNGRFSFICNKGFFISSPPSTSCTFKIKAGNNTNDITTLISKTSGQKVATISMNELFAKDLDGIFPVDSNGLTDYFLKTENGFVLEANGVISGNFNIGFSGQ